LHIVLRNVIIYLHMKFHFPKCSGSLSSEAEILTKHLYCRHLVPYHSVNILPLQKLKISPLPLPLTISVSAHTSQVHVFSNLLALLGAHHFLHVSRIRVKSLNFRRLMSYIYMEHPFLMFLDHTQRRSTVGRTPLDE